MDNIIIRPAIADDAFEFTTLGNFVWRNAYSHIFPEEVFLEKEAKAPKKIAEFPQVCTTTNERIVRVAEFQNKIVGFMIGVRHSNYQHFASLGYAGLMALYIHPDFQHKGIGKALKLMKNGAENLIIIHNHLLN